MTRFALAAAVLTVLIAPLWSARSPHSAFAAVTFSKNDPTVAPSRGTAAEAIAFARRMGASPMAQVEGYINEVYRLAPLVGIDPSIVIAQSAHETANWTSYYWRNFFNAAGIGIYAAGVNSYRWLSGVDSARYHLVHYHVYVIGVPLAGNPLYPYRTNGPGYGVAVALGYAGRCHVLDDFTGRWAVDPIYGQLVANRGNAIYGGTPPTTTPTTTPTLLPVFPVGSRVRVVTDLLNLRSGPAKSEGILVAMPTGTPGTVIDGPVTASGITWYQLSTSLGLEGWAAAFDNGSVYLQAIAGTPTPTPTSTKTPTATRTSTATPTRTPTPAPVAFTVVRSSSSRDATSAALARDGSLATDWHTMSATPPVAGQVIFDLGAMRNITRIEWQFRLNGGAAAYRIDASDDRVSWRNLSRLSGSQAGSWQSLTRNINARYIRVGFTNPTSAPTLGYLAEIRFLGPPSSFTTASIAPTATSTHSPTATPIATLVPIPTEPSVSGEPLAIVDSSGSASTTGSSKAWDGDLTTDWHTLGGGAPTSARLVLDTGSSGSIAAVQWYLAQEGGADSLAIETLDDNATWVIRALVSGGAPSVWHSHLLGMDARYVRFTFANPTGASELGFVAEVRLFGEVRSNGTTVAETSTTPTPTTSPTQTPGPAETTPPEPTATETETATPTFEPPLAPTPEVAPTESATPEPSPTEPAVIEPEEVGSPPPG